MFAEINLFNNENRELKKCFSFFFIVAICGYLAIMVSGYPHDDDYCRYLVNVNVGTFSSNRIFTFLLESFTYLSNTITDIAPFSHVLSCFFLSYGAVVCLKIFNIDLNNKLEVACFVPVAVNPYMLEIMLYRFDNPFSTLALLLCIIAAYVSTKNKKELLLTQTGLFLLSVFMYQPATSAYFILGIMKFLEELCEGRSFSQTISKMRYWLYTVLISIIVYIPFTYRITYPTTSDGSVVALPINIGNINIIAWNIVAYYKNLWTDWSGNNAGIILFATFIIYVLYSLTKLKIKKFTIICAYIFGVFALTLCPLGASVILKTFFFQGNETIPPRILYSMGILISGAIYRTSSLFKISEKFYRFYGFVVAFFCLWNIIFMNSSGNIIRNFRILQRQVLYDVSKDIHEIRKQNKTLLKFFCCTGNLQTYAMNNFAELYPIIYKIIPEPWYMPTMCRIAMIDYNFAESFKKYLSANKSFAPNKCSNKKLIKSRHLYDIFILDNEVIQVHFKSSRKFEERFLDYAQIDE